MQHCILASYDTNERLSSPYLFYSPEISIERILHKKEIAKYFLNFLCIGKNGIS
jgi:hypothetical protein